MNKESIKVKGEVFIDVKSKDGSSRQIKVNNVVTNAGKEFFVKRIFEDNTDDKISEIAIGKNFANQTVSDNIDTLVDPIYKDINYGSSAIVDNEDVNVPNNSIIYLTNFFDNLNETLVKDNNDDELNSPSSDSWPELEIGAAVPIGEIALIATDINASPSSATRKLICRTTFDEGNTFTKQKDDVITITWRITIN